MGCAQGKYPINSASTGLEKLKMENGYVAKEGRAPHRRSTGQRYSGKLYNNMPHQPLPPRKYDGGSSSGESGGNRKERTLSDRDGKREVHGGKGSQRVVEFGGEEVVDGWPRWLIDNVPRDVLDSLVPKSAENYDKLDKVGQGTYSNVYKARDRDTGKIVALKKVRFDTSEPESVKFMAREIMILQKLDHPNVVKLEGLATSRLQYSLYLVFDFMQSDLASIICCLQGRLTEPQVKCYMHQLLSGLQHCHDKGILHRDIKGSNLLIDKNGVLKIADFGLANYYSPNHKRPLTSRVVTLWYRAPELLLGATNYGVGIDLWGAGCLLAEMFAGRPILPGKTEVEQLHRIFKLCGTPPEDYWKKLRLSTTFRPPQSYKPRIFEAFSDFPESSLGLLTTLLSLEPERRGCASSALQDELSCSGQNVCAITWCHANGLPVIWREEDELAEANDQRRGRNSKMKRRSRHHEHRNDQGAEKPKEVSTYSKEELEKAAKPTFQIREPGSSSSSTSSGTRLTLQAESPPFLLSPVSSPNQKMSPRTQSRPNGSKNIKNLPPLSVSKTGSAKYNNDNMHRFNQVHRSASAREVRKFNERKHIEANAIDD